MHQHPFCFWKSHLNGLIVVIKMSIKLADIHVRKEPLSTSTKTYMQREQLTVVVFSSALIPLKHSFCVNRTVSGTLWLSHPSLLPPSSGLSFPPPSLPARTDSVGISPPNDLSPHTVFFFGNTQHWILSSSLYSFDLKYIYAFFHLSAFKHSNTICAYISRDADLYSGTRTLVNLCTNSLSCYYT